MCPARAAAALSLITLDKSGAFEIYLTKLESRPLCALIASREEEEEVNENESNLWSLSYPFGCHLRQLSRVYSIDGHRAQCEGHLFAISLSLSIARREAKLGFANVVWHDKQDKNLYTQS